MKRTAREIDIVACERATQAMIAAGWGVYPVGIIGNVMEDQYWTDWADAWEEAQSELEAENETIHTKKT